MTAALLGRLDGFTGMEGRELERLARLFEVVTLPVGAVLTREGFIGTECFLLVEGRAAVFVSGQRVSTVGPGEFLGEMGMLSHSPRCATVVAETPIKALLAGPQDFPGLLSSEIVLRNMVTKMSHRLADAQQTRRGVAAGPPDLQRGAARP